MTKMTVGTPEPDSSETILHTMIIRDVVVSLMLAVKDM